MTEPVGAGWRFLPPTAGAADDLAAARREGPAAFSRALRAARAAIGSARTAARLRALGRSGPIVRLLLAAPIQPQSLVDALDVAFAIAGLAVEVEPVEGFASLAERIADGAAVDLAVLFDPSDADPPGPALPVVAADLAARAKAPVALARFGADIAEAGLEAGVDRLSVGIEAAAAFDRRFAASFGTILKPAAADAVADAIAGWAARRLGRAPKLLVTDLDGTLWTGILGERNGGEAAPPLHRKYAEALAILASRGIVLAVASRNAPGDVDAVFASVAVQPLAHDAFAAMAVGWADKAHLVETVLADLGLAAEHAVFVDDDPVNCAKVAACFPEMDVRLFSGDPDRFAERLLQDPLLLGGGAESAQRTGRYRAKAAVDRLRSEAVDVGAFLAALGTRLSFERIGPKDARRAAELASRVNQFVLNGFRPAAPMLAGRRSRFDVLVRLDDAFGSHGIVGLMLASPSDGALLLENLYLSCRALERGVEDAMLAGLADRARQAGLTRIVGRLEHLPRNAPARGFLARIATLAADGRFDYPVGEDGVPSEGAPIVEWQLDEDEA